MTTNLSLINHLKRRINFLRSIVLVILASLVLLTILVVSISFYYADLSTNTVFLTTPFSSNSSKEPKAILYLSPDRGEYKVGDEFDVDVLVDTRGNNVVVAAAYLSYKKDKIEAIAINISNSVFPMQAEKEIIPQEGKIKITLGKPTPGINLKDGRVATVRFKALEPISPWVDNIYFNFTPGSSLYSTVILDDKLGSNILFSTFGTKIYIKQ